MDAKWPLAKRCPPGSALTLPSIKAFGQMSDFTGQTLKPLNLALDAVACGLSSHGRSCRVAILPSHIHHATWVGANLVAQTRNSSQSVDEFLVVETFPDLQSQKKPGMDSIVILGHLKKVTAPYSELQSADEFQ